VVVSKLKFGWHLTATAIFGFGATRLEGTTRWQVGRIGRLSLDAPEAFAAVSEAGNRV
jgi:hypothetical protein